ncbi:LytTR family DNA-binding domain-containing protein, partial [Sphingorhabdus sp.]|uniref:LytR/AlgR family response regulator transcription factor n=1 Tax=Sphingorhabdus sp. TaxID=1902408 RepID=UPI0032B87785
AEASGCATGLSRFAEYRPDIVIVDIKMRDGSGFDFVERLKPGRCPVVIFATAFDSFAARAFETGVVDYVLKPIEIPRLRAALHRARRRLSDNAAADTIVELKAVIENLRRSIPGQEKPLEREVWVRGTHGAMTRVNLIDIQLVTSEDDYIRLHLSERSFLIRLSIKAFADQVPEGEFIRVHRTALVRRSEIVGVTRSDGSLHAVLTDGRLVQTGRVYARALTALTKGARLD